MSDPYVLAKDTKLSNFVKSRFPGYRKRKVYIHKLDVPVRALETALGGWSGGSRDEEWIVKGSVNSVSAAPQQAPFGRDAPGVVEIGSDTCKVTTGTFCGKEATMSISCTEEFFNAFLA